MHRTFVINGSAITDIASFYDEINRVFMAGESWTLGQSLDALDDLLYGGYGALSGVEVATIVWTNMAVSRASLGVETTRAYLRDKLQRPDVFSPDLVSRQLAELEQGSGSTYFDIIMDIFAGHPGIHLTAA